MGEGGRSWLYFLSDLGSRVAKIATVVISGRLFSGLSSTFSSAAGRRTVESSGRMAATPALVDGAFLAQGFTQPPMRRASADAPQMATSPVVLWSVGVGFVKNSVKVEQEQALDLIAFSFFRVFDANVQDHVVFYYFLRVLYVNCTPPTSV